ncbi:MAG: DUF6042 family protein [Actinomycetota bacterium]|nr:DUF6042 family protein [Actinomycetota bacterium]
MRFPDEAATPAEKRALHFQDIYFGRGWARYIPAGAILILGALANHGPLNRVELGDWMRAARRQGENGWDAPAWDPVKVWTDDEWQRVRANEVDSPFGFDPDEPADAAGVNAEEIERREEELARSDAYSAGLGLGPVRTMGELLQYLIACGVLAEQRDGEKVMYDLNPDVALPSEVLPLSNEDRATEDTLRWRDVHEATAQSIITLFDPDGDDPPEWKRTSLQRLARELDSDVESVRAGVLNLLNEGDFNTTINVEQAAPHQVFELVVD